MTIKAVGGGKATVSAVVTRADGTVEDWGRVTHASERDRMLYELLHPKLMLKRMLWRRKHSQRTETKQ